MSDINNFKKKNLCFALVSKNNKKHRCKNKAISKEDSCLYCGIHYKLFKKGTVKNFPIDIDNIHKSRNVFNSNLLSINKLDYSNNIDEIIILQTFFRKLIVCFNIKNRGIAVYNRKLCNNNTDFLSFDPLETINNNDFFSYKDGKHTWGFKIVTFKEILKYNLNNPYNTQSIPLNIKNDFKNLLSKIEKKKKSKFKKLI